MNEIRTPESFSGCSYFMYLHKVGQENVKELIVFNQLRADIFFSLVNAPEQDVFMTDVREIYELSTYVYNRDPKIENLDETDVFECMALLKQKGLITKFKKEGDIVKYRISSDITLIASEEIKIVRKMIGKEGVSNASKNYIKFIQFALFKVKSGSKPTEFNNVIIRPGELFIGKTRISKELGINPEDTIELIQKAIETSFVEVVEWMSGESSRGSFTYPKYYFTARYKNGEDLFAIPFAGSKYEESLQLSKATPINRIINLLLFTKNRFITIEESKIVQRSLDHLLPKDSIMEYTKRLEYADKITDAMAEFEVLDLVEAYRQINKEHEEENFTNLELMYDRLIKLLNKDVRKELGIVSEDTPKEKPKKDKSYGLPKEKRYPGLSDVGSRIFSKKSMIVMEDEYGDTYITSEEEEDEDEDLPDEFNDFDV